MARCGRPRKSGDRYPSGKLKISTSGERGDRVDRAFVLAQPHRCGESSQLAENPLGRFVLAHKLRRELFDAGERYAVTKRKWLSTAGARFVTTIRGKGGDVDVELVREWRDATIAAEGAMTRAAGIPGALAVANLALHQIEWPPRGDVARTVRALMALAVFYGLLPDKVLLEKEKAGANPG